MTKAPLGQRLFEIGSPNPEYALLGSVNWMRALAIASDRNAATSWVVNTAHSASWKRETRQDLQDAAFEKVFLAQNYLAAIASLAKVPNPHDVARIAIVAWYYCIYFSSQAMLAISGQTVPEEHQKTARVWLNQLVTGPAKALVPYPFDLHLTTLVKTNVDEWCNQAGRGTNHSLNIAPATVDQAHDAHLSYLKGTAGFYREQVEDGVRESRDFKNAGYKDFRTKAARELRDEALQKRGVGFLDMAFRYRGKANYRDAIFLCYGSYGVDMNRFIADTYAVADAYHQMAQTWVSMRIPKDDWSHLLDDLGKNSRLTAAT